MMLKTGHTSSQKFSLTPHQFSVLCPTDYPTGAIDFYKWKFSVPLNSASKESSKTVGDDKYEINSTNDIMELSSVDKQCLIIDPTIIDLAENESHMDLTLSTIKNELHVVQFLSYPIQEWAPEKRCSIILLDGATDQPRFMKKVVLPTLTKGFVQLADFKNEKYLLKHHNPDSDNNSLEENKIWFFDILKEKTIEDYRMADISELIQGCSSLEENTNDQNSHELSSYDARFDLGRNQFIIFKEFLSGFVIYQYDDDENPSKSGIPRIVYKGSMFCPLSTRSTFLLLNGVIFATCQKETEMMPLSPDFNRYEHDNDAMELIAVDLEVKQTQTLTSFGVSGQENSKLLLNETHRSLTYQLKDHLSGRPTLRSVTDTVLVMQSTKNTYFKIDLNISPEDIAIADANAMYAKQVCVKI